MRSSDAFLEDDGRCAVRGSPVAIIGFGASDCDATLVVEVASSLLMSWSSR